MLFVNLKKRLKEIFIGDQEVKDARKRIANLEGKQERRGQELSHKDQNALEKAKDITRRHVIGLILKGSGAIGLMSALSWFAASGNREEAANGKIEAKEGQRLVQTVYLDERGLLAEPELLSSLPEGSGEVIKEAFDKYYKDYDFKGQVAVVKGNSRETYIPSMGIMALAPEVTFPGVIRLNPDFFNKTNDPDVLRNVIRHSITHAQKPKEEEYTPEKPFQFHNANVKLLGFHGLFVLVTNNETGETQRFTYFEESVCETLGRNKNPSYRASNPSYHNMGRLTMHAVDGQGLPIGTAEKSLLKMAQSNDVWGFVKLMTGKKSPDYDDLEWLIDIYTDAYDQKRPAEEILKELDSYRKEG